MRWLFAPVLALTLCMFAAISAGPARADGASFHDFEMTAIDGGALPLSQYRGKPVLLVNTASRCGFTPQYEGLQSLHERYRDAGLVVLGVPSNDFRQELSSAGEVKTFCEVNFGIDFPMTDIAHVKGANAHPVFAWMAGEGAEPGWNFNKFLISADGGLKAHFGSTTSPDSAGLIAAVEAELAAIN